MTVPELAAECQRCLDAGLKYVALVLPRPPGRSNRMRLHGRRGPLGELACVNNAGHSVVHFEVLDVLAYLAAAGLIEVKTRGQPQAP